jgi:hypothetical protein
MKMIFKSAMLLTVFSLLSCNTDEKEAVKDSFDSFFSELEDCRFDKAAKYADGDLVDILEEMAEEYDALSRDQRIEFKEYLGDADFSIESVEFDGFSIFSSPEEATIVLDGKLKEIDLIKKKDTWVIKESNKKIKRLLEEALEELQSYNTYSGDYGYDDNLYSGDYGFDDNTYSGDYGYEDYASDTQRVYYCNNGREIPYSYLNDGDCDCGGDCEDEYVFICGDGQAITRDWLYDGDCDCNDCSDE